MTASTDLMTADEIKLAREGGKIARAHLEGVKMLEGIKMGMSLLVGRRVAMQRADVNIPRGNPYTAYFQEWKREFKFPEGQREDRFYDEAIVCAQNYEIANRIIAALAVKQRAEMGVFGLAKRIRAYIKPEAQAKPKTVTKNVLAEAVIAVSGRLSDVERKQMATEPLKWWLKDPAAMARVMAAEDPVAMRTLVKAGAETLGQQIDLAPERPKPSPTMRNFLDLAAELLPANMPLIAAAFELITRYELRMVPLAAGKESRYVGFYEAYKGHPDFSEKVFETYLAWEKEQEAKHPEDLERWREKARAKVKPTAKTSKTAGDP
jgi:hypothetical protein